MPFTTLLRMFKKISSSAGKKYFAVFLIIFCSGFQSAILAQTIKGTVTDESGKPIPAASVTVKESSKGTVTDQNGRFTIAASPGNVLVVSSLGFVTKQVTLGDEKNVDITLSSTAQN